MWHYKDSQSTEARLEMAIPCYFDETYITAKVTIIFGQNILIKL